MYVFLASLPMVVCKIEGLPKGYLGKDETSVSAVPAHSAPCTPVMKITLGQSLKHDVICKYPFTHSPYPTHHEPLKA